LKKPNITYICNPWINSGFRYSYRINSRRFIQELFMDLQFEPLYVEASQLLGGDLAEAAEHPAEAAEAAARPSRTLAQVTEALTEDVLSSAASSPFS
jgi:hypothetical protein